MGSSRRGAPLLRERDVRPVGLADFRVGKRQEAQCAITGLIQVGVLCQTPHAPEGLHERVFGNIAVGHRRCMRKQPHHELLVSRRVRRREPESATIWFSLRGFLHLLNAWTRARDRGSKASWSTRPRRCTAAWTRCGAAAGGSVPRPAYDCPAHVDAHAPANTGRGS